MRIWQILLLTILSLHLFVRPSPCVTSQGIPGIWQPLYERLIQDGQDPDFLRALFRRPSVEFDPRVMPRKLTHKEAKLNYARFLKPERIARARKYLEKNRALLSEIQSEYGVPKEVKVAILLVETDLGNYLGAGSAFNILASMAAATDIDKVRPWLPPEFLDGPQRAQIERRLQKKSRWAYDELKALLQYTTINDMDPVDVRASIFGAIGLCQFMPSNALKYGVDFDKDGRVDLFKKADALASMANYLKAHGWRDNLDKKGQIKVILSYNYSRPYAETVLKVAERLLENSATRSTSLTKTKVAGSCCLRLFRPLPLHLEIFLLNPVPHDLPRQKVLQLSALP